MKHILKWGIFIFVAIALTACGAKLPKKIHQVKKGMSRVETQKILGKPNQVGLARMLDYDGLADFYEEKDAKVTVIFKEDKVEMVLLNQEVMKFDDK